MITAGDFKKGMTFEMDGEPYIIVDFQHVKPGKGAAFVRTKYKNLITGATREEAFNPNDKYNLARIETKHMQYLYQDGDLYHFMDNETYEQLPLPYETVKDQIVFVKENDTLDVRFFNGKVIEVHAPNFVELKVVESEPSVKGDSATNITKAAIVETGAEVQVPLFVNVGDTIKIDTRSGEYLSRV